jgi:hypothetical protein
VQAAQIPFPWKALQSILHATKPQPPATQHRHRQACRHGRPPHGIGVELSPPKGFLLLLPTPDIRHHVLTANAGLAVGRAKLQLMPWTRLAGVEAAKLQFWVRVCIEGIPHHACQEATVKQLLPQSTLLEGFARPNVHQSHSSPPSIQTTATAKASDAIPIRPILAWSELSPTMPHTDDRLLGPDGDIWFPSDPFHAHDVPTMYGPGTDGDPPHIATSPTATPSLDSEAEFRLVCWRHHHTQSHLLASPVTEDEIYRAVMEIPSEKAPGTSGRLVGTRPRLIWYWQSSKSLTSELRHGSCLIRQMWHCWQRKRVQKQ